MNQGRPPGASRGRTMLLAAGSTTAPRNMWSSSRALLRLLLALSLLGVTLPQTSAQGSKSVPACAVDGGSRQEVKCDEGAGSECTLAGRFRFPSQAIERRGDINDNAMIRDGEGLGKLVVRALDMHAGAPVFLKCTPAPEGRGTVRWPRVCAITRR